MYIYVIFFSYTVGKTGENNNYLTAGLNKYQKFRDSSNLRTRAYDTEANKDMPCYSATYANEISDLGYWPI